MRRELALTAIMCFCWLPLASSVQPLFFPKQVKNEWKLWKIAFEAAAGPEGHVSRAQVPVLFREHYKLIHNTLPGHETHEEIDESDVALFHGEAVEFARFVTNNDEFAEISLTWDAFKQQMYNFMDAKANRNAKLAQRT